MNDKPHPYGLGKWPPDEVREHNIPRVLYHVTPYSNAPSILRRGLRVREHPTFHTDIDDPDSLNRIYFTTSIEDASHLVDNLLSCTDKRVALLRVQLPPQTRVYREKPSTDPIDTVYVRTSIPPEYVRLVKVYE